MTDRIANNSNGVLGYSKILGRRSEIFASGFLEDSLRAASYELRLAKTKLILPNGKRYPEGKIYHEHLVLESGDVAFASSEERFHMPRDVTANVSVKFSFASKGVLGLNGMIVDPGYGSGTKEGSRLHFILANVGERTIVIDLCNDRFASLQFFPVCADAEATNSALATAKSPSIIDDLFSDPSLTLGLSFFATQRGLRERISNLEKNMARDVRGLNNVVNFGHFLLGSAVVGVVISFLLSWLSTSRAKAVVDLLSNHLGTTTEILLIVIIPFVTVPLGITCWLQRRNRRGSEGDHQV